MKRRTKRIAKKTIYILIPIILIPGLIFFLLNYKLSPLENIINISSSTIIRPYEKMNNIDDFERKMKDKKISYEYIKAIVGKEGYLAKISQGPRVYFSSDKDADYQIYSLQTMLTRLTIENKKPEVIDLRFDKPVVKF